MSFTDDGAKRVNPFTDEHLKRLKEWNRKRPIDAFACGFGDNFVSFNALLARLEKAEAFINESRCQNGCTCDGECEKHLPLEKAWQKSKGE